MKLPCSPACNLPYELTAIKQHHCLYQGVQGQGSAMRVCFSQEDLALEHVQVSLMLPGDDHTHLLGRASSTAWVALMRC